jgi:hypothetical protein
MRTHKAEDIDRAYGMDKVLFHYFVDLLAILCSKKGPWKNPQAGV